MAESRRLALARTYPMRADALQNILMHAAESAAAESPPTPEPR